MAASSRSARSARTRPGSSTPAIKQLAAEGGPLQPSLFKPAPAKAGDRDMPTGQARGQKAPEITSPDYPGERLVVCKNPLLAEERARKRVELLAATEKELALIVARVQRARSPLHGAAAIGQAVGAVVGRRTWPSISRSASPTTRSASPETPSLSSPRPCIPHVYPWQQRKRDRSSTYRRRSGRYGDLVLLAG
jgi:hypothetical protein